MADLRGLPPAYPELSKPITEGTWPVNRQAQYVQQPYVNPGSQIHVIHHAYNDPAIAQIQDWLPWSIIDSRSQMRNTYFLVSCNFLS